MVNQLDATATETLATALSNNVNVDTMLANLTTFIPVVASVLIFSFTYRILKKIISGASKGKARI